MVKALSMIACNGGRAVADRDQELRGVMDLVQLPQEADAVLPDMGDEGAEILHHHAEAQQREPQPRRLDVLRMRAEQRRQAGIGQLGDGEVADHHEGREAHIVHQRDEHRVQPAGLVAQDHRGETVPQVAAQGLWRFLGLDDIGDRRADQRADPCREHHDRIERPEMHLQLVQQCFPHAARPLSTAPPRPAASRPAECGSCRAAHRTIA